MGKIGCKYTSLNNTLLVLLENKNMDYQAGGGGRKGPVLLTQGAYRAERNLLNCVKE